MHVRSFWKNVLLGVVVAVGVAATPPEQEGRLYYTRANLWYDRDTVIDSTNYHAGDIIPPATRVRIDWLKDDRIGFSVDGKGSFTLQLIRKHSHRSLKIEDLFDQYFMERDPMAPQGRFFKFTRAEQRNIADGTLAVGMCKDAVYMAYGPPPTHKTPTLEGKTWTYWRGKMKSFSVIFDEDERVLELKGY